VYKTESGKFIYYNPSQTMSNVRATISNGISMDYVKDTQANIFAVRIHLEDGEMYAGNIITIITP
jgi:hypothetical protein